jgi:hypothetical protein
MKVTLDFNTQKKISHKKLRELLLDVIVAIDNMKKDKSIITSFHSDHDANYTLNNPKRN